MTYVLRLNSDGTVKAEQKISDTAGGLTATLDDGDYFVRPSPGSATSTATESVTWRSAPTTMPTAAQAAADLPSFP
ncbi:MAG: hypothetical protein R2710_00070 [Acidimicrobiales bacterium]